MSGDGTNPGPLAVSSQDPGDDVGSRFRYQYECGALLAIDLLNSASEFSELYCEHHEDLLLRRKDGLFVGRQVKTRQLHRGPFKADDSEMTKALCRFAELEAVHGPLFARYAIATNAAFHRSHDKHCLSQMCASARVLAGKPRGRLSGDLKEFVEALHGRSGADPKAIVSALSKTELNGELHSLHLGEAQVVRALQNIDGIGERPLEEVTRLARALVDLVARASSLPRAAVSSYFEVLNDPTRAQMLAEVEQKRVQPSHVKAILASQGIPSTPLVAGNHVTIENLPTGIRKLELKLAAGKVRPPHVQLAKDLKLSADKQLQQWYHRFGPKKANEMYQHVRTAVKWEALKAHDAVESDGPYGQAMLKELRERIKARRAADSSIQVLSEEQLTGVAGIITEDCELWWSDVQTRPRPSGERCLVGCDL